MSVTSNRKKLTYEESHKEIDGVIYKRCNQHEEFFQEENPWFPCNDEYFYKNKSNNIDGLYPFCKRCSIQKGINNARENKNKKKKYFKKYYKINKERKDKLHNDWVEKNKEYNKQYSAEYLKNNKDKTSRYSKKYSNKAHKITKKEWYDCKLYFDLKCAYCGKTWEQNKEETGRDLHKEHVIDCGRSDLKNCIPACRQCNSEKHTFSFNDWYNINNPKYSRERYIKIVNWIKTDCNKYILPKDKNIRKLFKNAS